MADVVGAAVDIECGCRINGSTLLSPLAPLPPRKRVDLSRKGRGEALRIACDTGR